MTDNLLGFVGACAIMAVIINPIGLYKAYKYKKEVIPREVKEFFQALDRHHENVCVGRDTKFPYHTIYDDCIVGHSKYDDMQKRLELVRKGKMNFDEFLDKRSA